MDARRATSSGVPPKPARSNRCAARVELQSAADKGCKSPVHVSGGEPMRSSAVAAGASSNCTIIVRIPNARHCAIILADLRMLEALPELYGVSLLRQLPRLRHPQQLCRIPPNDRIALIRRQIFQPLHHVHWLGVAHVCRTIAAHHYAIDTD